MSNPYLEKAKETTKAKMRHEGVQGEDQRDKAKRLAKGEHKEKE